MKRINAVLFILIVCAGAGGNVNAASSAIVNLTAEVVATYEVSVSDTNLDLSRLVTGADAWSKKVTITTTSNAPTGKLKISGCSASDGKLIKLKKDSSELPFSLVHTKDTAVLFAGGEWSHDVIFTNGTSTLDIWVKYEGEGMPPAPGTYTCALTIEAKAQ